MNVLLTGDREYRNIDAIHLVLNILQPNCIIHGDASGADEIAKQWGLLNNCSVYGFPAKWYEHDFQGKTFLQCFGNCKEGQVCKLAGPRRNREMIYMTNPDIVLAFHDYIFNSKGTRDMVKLSTEQNIFTLLYFNFHPLGPKHPLMSCVEIHSIGDDSAKFTVYNWVTKIVKE